MKDAGPELSDLSTEVLSTVSSQLDQSCLQLMTNFTEGETWPTCIPAIVAVTITVAVESYSVE